MTKEAARLVKQRLLRGVVSYLRKDFEIVIWTAGLVLLIPHIAKALRRQK